MSLKPFWQIPARRPWVIIALALVITLVLLPFARRVVIDSSMERVIRKDDPDRILLEDVQKDFGSDNILFILLDGPDFFSASSLRRIHRLTRSIESIPGVRRVVSLSNAMRIRGSEETIEVVNLVDMNHLEPDLLEEARRYAISNPLYHRNLVSADCHTTSINVFLRPMTDKEYYDLEIGDKIEGILKSETDGIKTFITGVPYVKEIITRSMEQDLRRLVPLSLLLVTAVLVVSFRSLRGVTLPLLTVALSLGWTIGLMGLCGEPMTLVSSVLPPLLISLGSAYSIHVLSEHRNQSSHQGDGPLLSLRTMENVGLPVILTGLTTIVGFASLAVDRIPAIRAVGLFASFGILCALTISITLVPALLSLMGSGEPPGVKAGIDRSKKYLEALGRFVVRRRWIILVISALLTLWGSAGICRLTVNLDVMSFFKKNSFLHEVKRTFHEKLAGTAPLFLVIEGAHPDTFKEPETLQLVEDLQEYLEGLEEIDTTTSVLNYIKLANRALWDNDPRQEKIPNTREQVAEVLFLLSMSLDPEEIDAFINSDSSRINILLRTDLASSTGSRTVLSEISRYLGEHFPATLRARVIGTQVLFNHTADTLTIEQIKSLGLALVVIFCMMAAPFRSIRIGLLSMIPNLVPILLFFGIMGWTGIPLNINTIMIASIALGIAVDDTIHLLSSFNKAELRSKELEAAILITLSDVGIPCTLTTVTLCIGFSIFTISNFIPVVQFGALSAMTLAIGLVAEIVLLPSLLALVGRARRTGGRRAG